MKHIKYYSVLVLTLLVVAYSCKKPGSDDNNNVNPGPQIVDMTPYTLPHPAYFPRAVIPEDNELTEERIALGKKLFFDTRLSNDGSSCETCHLQELGFSKKGVSIPDNGLTSLPLINLAWYKNFMWNNRIIGTIEDVMFAEVTVRFETDIDKINAIPEYKDEFAKYYGVSNITANNIAYALAQYMRVLVSKNTRDERATALKTQLTPFELAGREIFFTEKGDCFHCHSQIVFTDNDLHNTGLDSATYAKEIDKGYYNVTKDPNDLGKFRTPNLRNVALRTHFMHDGRFTTLEEVVDFYNDGFKRVSNIDPVMLKPGKEDGLNLTNTEKQQLIAYLKTLTDSTMITDPFFSKP